MTDISWSAALAEAIAANGVPGASLGLWQADATTFATAGVANLATGAPVGINTIFRLGSATKLLTAALVMQQVEQGRLDLDAPVRACLPDFCLADDSAAELVTTRHLLSHQAGFFGDVLDGPSEGHDALAAYVAAGHRLEQVTRPGTAFSYCNAGFSVVGRMSEVVGGAPWDKLINRDILGPLGMSRSGPLLPGFPDGDAASPHVVDRKGHLVPLLQPPTGRALAPAGSLGWTTPADILVFARTFLSGGVAPNGHRLLSGRSVDEMRALAAAGPTSTFATGWGLGLQRFTADGGTFGHDGAVAGQNSFVRIVPSEDMIVALFCNGGDAHGLFSEVMERVQRHSGRTLVDPIPPWPESSRVADAVRFAGRYGVSNYAVVVEPCDEGLHARVISSSKTDEASTSIEVSMRAQADDPSGTLFLVRWPGSRLPVQQRFIVAPAGEMFLLFRGRLLPRIEEQDDHL